MPRSRPPKETASRPEDSPIAWFGEMLLALDRGDYRRATESQDQLSRLGWSVRRREPRRTQKGVSQ
jgi:hypothetical protein